MMVAFSYVCMGAGKNEMNVESNTWIYLCRRCKMNLTLQMRENNQPYQAPLVPMSFSVPEIPVGKCFICQEDNPDFEVRLSTRMSIFIAAELLLDPGTRICIRHIDRSTLMIDSNVDLTAIPATEQIVRMGSDDLQAWIKEQRQHALMYQKTGQQKIMKDFFLDMEEDDFNIVFGIQKHQFQEMFDSVETYRSNNGTKCKKSSLLLLLLKLRQGQTLSYLKALFGFKTKGAVSSQIKVARSALLEGFTVLHLGSRNLTRERVVPHMTNLARTLHLPQGNENNIVLTIDGTYVYLPKSNNHTELKRTYSVHKRRHLVKMTMCVMPDGFIVDVHGPYYGDGKNNDAATLTHDFEENISGLRDQCVPGDVLVVDRGYRDCISYIEGLGYQTRMPRFLQPRQKQHTTAEANESRIVTKTRWIVEVRNGHIKSIFKFFNRVIFAGDTPFIGEYFKIACAIINAYRPCITTNDDNIGAELLRRQELNNEVLEFVEMHGLRRKRVTGWKMMEEVELEEFLRLTHEELRSLTLGEFQIRLAPGYNAEAEDRYEGRVFEIARESPSLMSARLHSRHTSQQERHQFIRFIADENSAQGIQGWYCDCVTGARTVGMCSHVCAIIWYFSRSLRNTTPPSEAPPTVCRIGCSKEGLIIIIELE